MNGNANMPFAGQRMICMALVFGMAMYAIVAGLVLQTNEGAGLADEPIEVLDTVALVVGIAAAVLGMFVRVLLTRKAEGTAKEDRATPRFLSRIVPLAILEGGCLLAITVWMLNGKAVPSLAVALVLLSFAIALIPLQDPDAEVA